MVGKILAFLMTATSLASACTVNGSSKRKSDTREQLSFEETWKSEASKNGEGDIYNCVARAQISDSIDEQNYLYIRNYLKSEAPDAYFFQYDSGRVIYVFYIKHCKKMTSERSVNISGVTYRISPTTKTEVLPLIKSFG